MNANNKNRQQILSATNRFSFVVFFFSISLSRLLMFCLHCTFSAHAGMPFFVGCSSITYQKHFFLSSQIIFLVIFVSFAFGFGLFIINRFRLIHEANGQMERKYKWSNDILSVFLSLLMENETKTGGICSTDDIPLSNAHSDVAAKFIIFQNTSNENLIQSRYLFRSMVVVVAFFHFSWSFNSPMHTMRCVLMLLVHSSLCICWTHPLKHLIPLLFCWAALWCRPSLNRKKKIMNDRYVIPIVYLNAHNRQARKEEKKKPNSNVSISSYCARTALTALCWKKSIWNDAISVPQFDLLDANQLSLNQFIQLPIAAWHCTALHCTAQNNIDCMVWLIVVVKKLTFQTIKYAFNWLNILHRRQTLKSHLVHENDDQKKNNNETVVKINLF